MYPSYGIPAHYFPYNPSEVERQDYATPWVAIRFSVKLDADAKISCRSYAGNIKPKTGLFDTDQESRFAVEFHINPPPKNDEL